MNGPDATVPEFGGDFEILRTLGDTSFARVYLARETMLRRLVAIKVLADQFTAQSVDPRAVQRFEREAMSAARLTHPNIVKIHRVAALPSGDPYIVMEYVDGQNLADAMAAGILDETTSVELVGQIAGALAVAHGAGIVHREVSPDNILWDANARRAVLTDFGIAAFLETGMEAHTRLTRAGEVLGNPRYSSPEQLEGRPLTGATDVYALCNVAYELFAGRGPFDTTSVAGLTLAHVREEPTPLHTLAPHMSRELATLLTSGLAKRPEQRPRAADIATFAERHRAGQGSTSRAIFSNSALDDAADRLPAFRGFVEELRSRQVFNVAAVYGALTYVTLEVGSLVLPALPLPAWSYTALVAVVLGGFPIAVVLAWSYDLTAQGIQRAEQIAPNRKAIRALRALGLVASFVVAGLIGWWILNG